MLDVHESKANFDDILLALIKENEHKKKVESIIGKARLWNVSDETGNTLLHHAAESNNEDITQYLIKSGSKVDAQNARGKTPLIVAVEKDHRRIVKVLLKAGAHFDISDDSHKNALQLIIANIETMEDDNVQIIFKKLKKDCRRDEEITSKLLDAGWPFYCILQLCNSEITRLILINECSLHFHLFNQYEFRTILQWVTGTLQWRSVCELTPENTYITMKTEAERISNLYPSIKFSRSRLKKKKGRQSLPRRIIDIPGNRVIFEHSYDLDSATKDLETLEKEYQDISLNGRTNFAEASFATQLAIDRIMDVILNNGTVWDPKVKKSQCGSSSDKFFTFENRGHEKILEKSDFIYQVIFKGNFFTASELLLAQLALQECSGTPITECVLTVINSSERLKNYFGFCQRLLDKEVYGSATLFQLLNESIINFTNLVGNQETLEAMASFNERIKSKSYYFHILLQRRMEKAFGVNELCKILRVDYSSFPNIADTILDYLEWQDVLSLSKLRNSPQQQENLPSPNTMPLRRLSCCVNGFRKCVKSVK